MNICPLVIECCELVIIGTGSLESIFASDAPTVHLSPPLSQFSIGIASEIQSPETMADTEIWRDPKPQSPSEGHGVGDTASDIWITSATKMRLLADSETPALDINVDTLSGVVTLFGVVPSQEAKAAAEADARKVSGVMRWFSS
jgi:hypothetical protein